MIGDKEIKLDEDKLLINVNNETIEYNYTRLSVILWRKKFIDIAYDKKILCVIPINIFDSVEDKEKFVKILKDKTGK